MRVTGRFAPSSVRPCTFRPQDVSLPGRIQHFLVTLYILSFIIIKLPLTTFIKTNDDDDDPAYSHIFTELLKKFNQNFAICCVYAKLQNFVHLAQNYLCFPSDGNS